MLLALFLGVFAVADAACCSNKLTYTVTPVSGQLNYNFASNYPSDSLSNGVNKSIAVVKGCPVDFVLSGLSSHPFQIQFAGNASNIPNFNQGQTSGTQTWDVPSDPASSTTYQFQCSFHPSMHNYIRVLDNCDMAGVPKDCDVYCANIKATCNGSNIQFPDPDVYSACMASCLYYPDNSTLSTSGDSFQCRSYQLSRGSAYCNSAGFNGGAYGNANNMCGSFCDAYCDAIMGGCTNIAPLTSAVFNNRDECMRECSYYPKNSSFDLGSSAVQFNNSIDCRSWHVQVAINLTTTPSQNMQHCGHASPQGGSVCGTGCDNYCNNVQTVCKNNLQQWNDNAQCLLACRTWPQQNTISWASNPITSGNSLPCRKYHASVAGISPSSADVHFIHSGPLGGDGICGLECEGLCNLAVAACPSVVTSATCPGLCAALNSSDGWNTTEILDGSVPRGSVGCATHFALKALADNSLCSKLDTEIKAAPGGVCDKSSAVLLKVSWTIIAVIFLALGFTSDI